MAKVTLVLCDVKPCMSDAECEFQVNGQTFYVCGEQCFAKFWSREYSNWKGSPHSIQMTFHHLALMQDYETREISQRKVGIEIFRSDLGAVK